MDFNNYWNSHAIRANRTAECPSGIPDDLYQMPEEFGEYYSHNNNYNNIYYYTTITITIINA